MTRSSPSSSLLSPPPSSPLSPSLPLFLTLPPPGCGSGMRGAVLPPLRCELLDHRPPAPLRRPWRPCNVSKNKTKQKDKKRGRGRGGEKEERRRRENKNGSFTCSRYWTGRFMIRFLPSLRTLKTTHNFWAIICVHVALFFFNFLFMPLSTCI